MGGLLWATRNCESGQDFSVALVHKRPTRKSLPINPNTNGLLVGKQNSDNHALQQD